MDNHSLFYLQNGNIFAVPIIHYNMEMAAHVCKIFHELKPDCVAVELAETMQSTLLHAASRLPDISVVLTQSAQSNPLYYMCEPCDAAFEGLRCALENGLPAFCIDLDIDFYPDVRERLPDPYAIYKIGLQTYYESYFNSLSDMEVPRRPVDDQRELHMAKRLKELSLQYDRVLFIGGMAHVANILESVNNSSFQIQKHAVRDKVELFTLTETSCREVLAEYGWISQQYEALRTEYINDLSTTFNFPPDRQNSF